MISDQFYDDVIALLSGTLVDVELEKSDVDRAYRMAVKTHKQKGNSNTYAKYIPLEVKAGQKTYQLPEEVNTVTEIIRRRSDSGFTSGDPFVEFGINQMFGGSSYSHGSSDFMLYDLTKQMLEINETYTASEPNYRFDRHRHVLTLHNPPAHDKTWLMDVYVDETNEFYEESLWILNWTIAECKQMLGRAYRQFGGLPSPSGETQTDGDQLVQESKEEKRELLEEIENFTDGDADGLGIWIF